MNRATSLRVFVHRFVVALLVVVVLSGAGVIAVNALLDRKISSIHTVKLPNNLLTPEKPGAPANYLLIGSDSRAFVDTPQEAQSYGSTKEVGGARSDVMMVVHVEPATGSVYVVSFPRDTVVEIPGHGHNKLNAAFALGGPALAILTFQTAFGVPIQHYLAVDFQGFERIVDAIGHVKIQFPTPALDTYTGLYEPVAGCASLDGVSALAYARSRHYLIPQRHATNPDPRRPRSDWTEDPTSDLDRILRQQYFLRSLGQTALDHGAGNPLTALRLTNAVVKSLKRDESLTSSDLKSLVRAFRGLDPATVEMTTLPVGSGRGGLVPSYPAADPVIGRLKDLRVILKQLPTAVAPSTVKVVVVNGSGVKGRGAAVLAALVARGFRAGGPAVDADRSNYPKTQIRYAPGETAKGLTAALYLGAGNLAAAAGGSVTFGDRTLSGDVIVVVGRDYPKLHGLLSQPAPAGTAPTTPAVPTTLALPTGTTPTTTPTTLPANTPDTRFVPVAPSSLRPLVGCP